MDVELFQVILRRKTAAYCGRGLNRVQAMEAARREMLEAAAGVMPAGEFFCYRAVLTGLGQRLDGVDPAA